MAWLSPRNSRNSSTFASLPPWACFHLVPQPWRRPMGGRWSCGNPSIIPIFSASKAPPWGSLNPPSWIWRRSRGKFFQVDKDFLKVSVLEATSDWRFHQPSERLVKFDETFYSSSIGPNGSFAVDLKLEVNPDALPLDAENVNVTLQVTFPKKMDPTVFSVMIPMNNTGVPAEGESYSHGGDLVHCVLDADLSGGRRGLCLPGWSGTKFLLPNGPNVQWKAPKLHRAAENLSWAESVSRFWFSAMMDFGFWDTLFQTPSKLMQIDANCWYNKNGPCKVVRLIFSQSRKVTSAIWVNVCSHKSGPFVLHSHVLGASRKSLLVASPQVANGAAESGSPCLLWRSEKK